MTIETVAIVSTGDMGHALGRRLRDHGLRVITSLRGRSARTAALAATAGIENVAEDAQLVAEADVVLAVLAPAAALDLADRVAEAARGNRADLLYVECNAIAPQTVRTIASHLEKAGVRVVDAGIIGGPPRSGGADEGPRIYASGNNAAEFARLRDYGLDVRVLGSEIGQASGLKMCYAALTKGLSALATELLVAGRAMNLNDALHAELESSQGSLLRWIERALPGMPPKADRWVGEMEEIAATFGAPGLTPLLHQGAADLYRFVTTTPLGDETPEARHLGQTADDVIAVLAGSLASALQDEAAAE